MTGASVQFLARVPCLGSSGIDREPVAVRFRARLRWRAHSDINPGSQQAINPASHQSVAFDPSGNVIAAVSSPRWRRLAARTLERSGPNTGARALAAFVSRGQRLILNLRGGFKALRSLLPSNPLIPLRQEPTSGRFDRFVFSPIPLLSAAHDEQHAAKEILNVGKAVRKTGNV